MERSLPVHELTNHYAQNLLSASMEIARAGLCGGQRALGCRSVDSGAVLCGGQQGSDVQRTAGRNVIFLSNRERYQIIVSFFFILHDNMTYFLSGRLSVTLFP